MAALDNADHALVVIDDSDPARAEEGLLPRAIPYTRVFNKIDLTHRASGNFTYGDRPAVAVSAKSGAGLALLRQTIKRIAGYQDAEASTFIARRRHLHALQQAMDHIQVGREHLLTARAGELLAEELRLAQRSLGEITGEFSSEELLGRIFSSFCIGK